MKKLVSLFAAALLVLCGVMFAEVFASRTSISNPNGSSFDGKLNDGTGVKIWYYLNDTATAIVVKVMNASTNAVVATINASNQGRFSNPNSVTWDGTGSAVGAKYYVTITTTGLVYSDTKYTSFYFQATKPLGDISVGIYTRGVDINTNMNNKGFGYWYASNSDAQAGGYKTGTLRYNPDGTFAGTVAGHPSLVNTLGTDNGGTYDWGLTAPWTAVLDSKGRVYQVSNGGNFVTRLDNDSAVPKIIIQNITKPRGIFVKGEGANLKLYIAADTVVWRANIGNDDILNTPLELVASLGLYVRDVILDDEGKMLVTLRTDELTPPGYVERYDISGALPKKRSDALLQEATEFGLPVCFALKHGTDLNSASDDTIYYAVRRGLGTDNTTYGIHQLTAFDGFSERKQIYKNDDNPLSAGGNNRQDADIALDWGGNIIWFENGNEEIVMIAVPRIGSTVTLTTRAYDTISVAASNSVGSGSVSPDEFMLNQNYPNPFNPSTTISYQIPTDAKVTVMVYDLLGNIVSELFDGFANAGYNAIVWDATNKAGSKVSSGMYLYRINAYLNDGRMFAEVRRMMLLK
ncbi:MAG: FlgD immunoglobulin-like domain containing protein [Bacteroidota bacterium]|nr:FlgD immunoglobulin-like domain containing protein [Bacteroidota bacterium]